MRNNIAIGLIVFVLLIAFAACNSPASTPQQRNPVLIKEWSGTGITTTETFTISENPWSIKWQSNPTMMNGSSMGMLQVYVYRTDNPNIPIALAANTSEATSGTSYVYNSGTFYLTINAGNTAWDVQIWGFNKGGSASCLPHEENSMPKSPNPSDFDYGAFCTTTHFAVECRQLHDSAGRAKFNKWVGLW